MKPLFFYIFILFLAGFFVCLPTGSLQAVTEETPYKPEKLFYVSQKNVVSALDSLEKNWEKVDIVAPQMYAVGTDLKLYGALGPRFKKIIKDHNLKVMPLVVNVAFKRSAIHNLLLSAKAQDQIIKDLIRLAKKNKYIGWQYDFENIDYKDKDLYSAFVKKTYKEFKKNKLQLSVAAVARYVDYEDTVAFKSWSGAYDFKKIAENSDFVSLMVYDDPKSVGPVASLDFVSKCLKYVEDKIPPQKLSLGVPLYYWIWNADLNKKIGAGLYRTVMAIMKNYKYDLSFDATLGVSYLTYAYNNKNYKVWFEDQKSLQAKMRVAKAGNFRGFSAWQLGGEDPEIWSVLPKNN